MSKLRAALFCLCTVVCLSAVVADEADSRRKAVAALSQLGQTTPVLSKRLEPLSSYPPTRATVQQHQALVARLNSLLERAQAMLAGKKVDPRTLGVLEKKFRSVRSQLRHLRGDMRTKINRLVTEADAMSERARNEADKIKGHFQAWTEKANQVDQQLSSILRTLKDIRRIGVGGSDLGAS